MNYSAIVLAAGKGTRSGLSYNKVLFPYQNQPILQKSLDLFEADPDCKQIIVVCARNELERFKERFQNSKTLFTIGGKARQDSVFNGLKCTKEPYVLIHDGARPFVSLQLVERIKKALPKYQAVVPGIEVVDTIKEIDANGFFVRTPVRDHLRAVQTPQGFETKLVKEALQRAIQEGIPVTDDAMAVELFKHKKSYCVAGEQTNFKVTSQADLEKLASFLPEKNFLTGSTACQSENK
ncbi:2-C-methyl-D-erythritol 4-phosphate cytidylyltransferase [Erysipelotrichaceae bacterium RD49]|nr:2-C-methyl-D-erythritol 4-phosphate cytidylyltransferase [Erysipelotrichaceae bacterium RD49]